MNRTIEDIQKDIELLGIKGGYDIEQLLTPQDCRRLSYEIERLNNIINDLKLCNSDYYNQLNTLSSKISMLRKYIEDKNKLILNQHRRELLKIIDDNIIVLGSDKE